MKTETQTIVEPRRGSNTLPLIVILLLAPVLSGCDVIEAIFKIGFWSGVIIVGLILAAVWAALRFTRRRRGT